MFSTSTVKTALKVDVAISQPMANALQLWGPMYQNRAPWLVNGVKSLNLPAAIAGEIARTATIELKVELKGSPRAVFLAAQFGPVLAKLREQTEKGAAKGGIIFKPYISGKGLAVDYVQADAFFPVSFDANGNITAVIFADQRQAGDQFYTRLEFHRMIQSGCEITNVAYKSITRDTLGNQVPLTDIEDWAGLEPQATILGIDRPLFAYFRFPKANNVDTSSPLGVSCYSGAEGLIEDADTIYSDLLWEFKSGRRKIYVDELALKNEKGEAVRPLDKNLYVGLDVPGSAIGDGNKLFEAWTPEFREASILSGLDAILKRIEYTCGLAYGTISDPNVEAKTATEIATTRQRSFATIKDTQKALQGTLDQLLWAMDIWITLGNLAPAGSYVPEYDWDDSILVDTDAQMAADRQTVTMGAMPKYVFLMRNYGLDEVTAKKWIAENQTETPQPTDMFGTQGV